MFVLYKPQAIKKVRVFTNLDFEELIKIPLLFFTLTTFYGIAGFWCIRVTCIYAWGV